MRAVSRTILVGMFCLALCCSYAQRTSLANPLDLYLAPPDSTELRTYKDTRSIVNPINIETWPLFCRLEEIAGQQAKTQIRVRLGSVDYVDYLEGKTTVSPRR